jgi:hypothetical protein
VKKVRDGIYAGKYKGSPIEVQLKSLENHMSSHTVKCEVISSPVGYEDKMPVGKIITIDGGNFARSFRQVKTPNIFGGINMDKKLVAVELVKVAKSLMAEIIMGKIPAKEEFKVGDILDPQGKTNMVGLVKIREISGNTLKFVDSKGTEYYGMQRSQVRNLVNSGSWKKVKGTAAVANELVKVADELVKVAKSLTADEGDELDKD